MKETLTDSTHLSFSSESIGTDSAAMSAIGGEFSSIVFVDKLKD